MHEDVDRILIPRHSIAARVAELAAQITREHMASSGGELTIVPILTGAMIFCCDLIRRIPMAMRIGLFTVSSYPDRSVQSQGPRVISEQVGDLRGRHVVLLDDILDSGGTLRIVVPVLSAMGPASLRTCVLLRKDRPAARATPVDYVGFDIPDEFVVGYGLDFNNYYRNLPDIVTLKSQAMSGAPNPGGGAFSPSAGNPRENGGADERQPPLQPSPGVAGEGAGDDSLQRSAPPEAIPRRS